MLRAGGFAAPFRRPAQHRERECSVFQGRLRTILAVLNGYAPFFKAVFMPFSTPKWLVLAVPTGWGCSDFANITVYNVPQEAYNLSDRDNKMTVSANVRKQMDVQRVSGLTTNELARLAREDAASGFESINNPAKWENVYGRVNSGTITVPSRIAIQNR